VSEPTLPLSFALPPFHTLTLVELQTALRQTAEYVSSPVPTSLDEYIIGPDDQRPLRYDEQTRPGRIYMFGGEPTAYACWLTRRVMRDPETRSLHSWNVDSIVTGFLLYQTPTAVAIIREMAADSDPRVTDRIIERLIRQRSWRAFGRLLQSGGALSERDVSRLEREAARFDARLEEQRSLQHKKESLDPKLREEERRRRRDTNPDDSALLDIMATAIVEAFHAAPCDALLDTLVEMQNSGMAVADLIVRFAETHSYSGYAAHRALGTLFASDAFSEAERQRVHAACTE
jgi:hypothetical protein